MRERIDIRVVVFIMLMLLIFGSMVFFQPTGVTGYAGNVPSPDDKDSFYLKYANTGVIEAAPQAFKDNIEIVKLAYAGAVTNNMKYPEIFISQMYKESSLIPNQLSCVCGSDSDRNKWMEYANCESNGCGDKVSQMQCTYAGCDSAQLDKTKSVSKNYGKYQTSCCIGLGQVWYLTAYDRGFRGSPSELLEPSANLDVAAKHMVWLLERYDGDYIYALAAYNWGQGNVDKKKDIYGTDYAGLLGSLPTETRTYVATILAVAPIAEQMIQNGQIILPDDFKVVTDISGYIHDNYGFTAPALSSIPSTVISVNPNFKTNIPYHFNDYEILKEDATAMIDKCTDPSQIDTCVGQEVKDYNLKYQNAVRKFEWHFGDDCIKQSSSFPNDFIEFLSYTEDCINSVNSDCICSPRPSGGQDYKFQQAGNNVEVSVEIGGTTYREAFEYVEIKDDSINAKYDFEHRFMTVGRVLGDTEYLGKDAAGKLTDDPNMYVRCIPSPTKMIPFCVSTDQEVHRYDGVGIKQDNILYQFALTFGVLQDQPVSGSAYIRSGVVTAIDTATGTDMVTKIGEAI